MAELLRSRTGRVPIWAAILAALAVVVGTVAFVAAPAQASGAPVLRGVAMASNDATPGFVTIARPEGVEPGDVMVAALDVSAAVDVYPPDGWELLRSDVFGRSLTKTTWLRTVTDEEPATYQWRHRGKKSAVGAIAAFSGVRAVASVDAIGGAMAGRNSEIFAPSITTTQPEAMLVGIFSIVANTALTSESDLVAIGHQPAQGLSTLLAVGIQPNAGPTGSKMAHASTRAVNGAHLIALAPRSGGTPDPPPSSSPSTTTTTTASTTTAPSPTAAPTTTTTADTTTTTIGDGSTTLPPTTTSALPTDSTDEQPPVDLDPSGSPIVFTHEPSGSCGRPCSSSTSLRSIRADGSELRQLTSPTDGFDQFPRWSPDGRNLAFTRTAWSSGAGEVYVIQVTDTGIGQPRRLTATSSLHGSGCATTKMVPVWSPDSSRLATTCAARTGTDSLVLTVGRDGSGQAALGKPASASDGQPTWSPDSGRLAFARMDRTKQVGDAGRSEIWVADAGTNGISNARQLVSTPRSATHPQWSPVGDRILFVDLDELVFRPSLRSVLSDGSALSTLFVPTGDQAVALYQAVWSPNGAGVALPVGDGVRTSAIRVLQPTESDATVQVGDSIKVMQVGSKMVSPPSVVAYAPGWSSGSTHLVFDVIVHDDVGNEVSKLAITALDGSSYHQLATSGGHNYDAHWRPTA